MTNNGFLKRIDPWLQSFLSPSNAQTAEMPVGEPIRASQKFSFLATAVLSLALLRAHRGGLVPLVTLLCIAIAANAPAERRKYYVVGVLAIIPIQIIVGLFLLLFPWHSSPCANRNPAFSATRYQWGGPLIRVFCE
jgi:hypothetical protein